MHNIFPKKHQTNGKRYIGFGHLWHDHDVEIISRISFGRIFR